MALYRQNSTGFLCEFASNPGAGYTAITAQPTDTITNHVNWWRALDTYGQTSNWHPSLQPTTNYPDDVGPPGLSGSGVNIAPARYQSFEEDGLPPLSVVSATTQQYPSGFHGSSCLRIIASTANAEVWYSSSKTADKNVKLTPNSRWIVSAYLATPTSVVRTCYLQLYTTTNTYIVPVATSGVAGQFTRVSGVFDLRGDSSATGTLGIKIAASGGDVLVDSNMMEAQIGSGTDPSEYSGVDSAIDGSQVEDATLVVEKLKSGTITGETIILGGSGSTIKSSNYVAGSSGWMIDGGGSAEFRNVTVRGTLNAGDLAAGTISSGRFGNDTIGAGPVVSGQLHKQYILSGQTSSVPYIGSTTINLGSCFVAGPISLPSNAYRSGTVILVNAFYDWNTVSNPGWLVGCAMTGYRTGSLLSRYIYWENGRDIMSFMTLHSAGTGALSYYIGLQQYVDNPYNVVCYYDMCVLEFSK